MFIVRYRVCWQGRHQGICRTTYTSSKIRDIEVVHTGTPKSRYSHIIRYVI
jgi:hypothetical protein